MTRATGPISPEELQRIADLPHGFATIELRKHDPMWGRETPDDRELPVRTWKVRIEQEVVMKAFVEVQARTEQEAELIAAGLPTATLSFDYSHTHGENIADVELMDK